MQAGFLSGYSKASLVLDDDSDDDDNDDDDDHDNDDNDNDEEHSEITGKARKTKSESQSAPEQTLSLSMPLSSCTLSTPASSSFAASSSSFCTRTFTPSTASVATATPTHHSRGHSTDDGLAPAQHRRGHSNNDDLIHRGCLAKKRPHGVRGLRSWQKRYMELRRTSGLAYFKKKTDKQPCGTIALDNIITAQFLPKAKCRFDVMTKGGRTYSFNTCSFAEAQGWVATITATLKAWESSTSPSGPLALSPCSNANVSANVSANASVSSANASANGSANARHSDAALAASPKSLSASPLCFIPIEDLQAIEPDAAVSPKGPMTAPTSPVSATA